MSASMHRLRTDLCQDNLPIIVRTLKTKKAVFLATCVNRKMTFFIYEQRFRPKFLSYRAICGPFFFWYQHSRRQMSTLKGAL